MRRVLETVSLILIIIGGELTTGAFSSALTRLGRVYAELSAGAEPGVSLNQFFLGVGFLIVGLFLLLLDLWAKASWTAVGRGKNCPQCGGETERVKRRNRHRLMGWVLGKRVVRRNCRECEWTGLTA